MTPEVLCFGEFCEMSPEAHIDVLIKNYSKFSLENFTTGLGPIWLFLQWGGGGRAGSTRKTMTAECHVIETVALSDLPAPLSSTSAQCKAI